MFGSYYSGFGGSHWFLREMERDRQREERERIRSLQRQAEGSRRRTVELEKLGRFVPAGEWDADCERWPEQTYTWGLGGGFTGTIMRNIGHWSWCCYVTLPEWYPSRTNPYDFWNGISPRAPVHKEFTYSEGGTLGWDHTWGGDLCPLAKPVSGGVGPNIGSHCRYTTAEVAIAEVWELASYFASMVLDGTLPAPAEPLAAAREDLFRIQQQEMVRAEEKRKEREAVAAAARAEAERKAAEEAARIAAEAERQRLWDLEHPLEAALRDATARSVTASTAAANAVRLHVEATREVQDAADKLRYTRDRIPRIRELLTEIEELRARADKGETLKAAEKRQMKRYDQLKADLKNRESLNNSWSAEEASFSAATSAASAAEAKSKEAAAAVTAAEAEVVAARTAIAKRDADVKAAEEARIAAEKAAAESKAAAQREEDTRIIKEARLRTVKKLLAEIDSLKARRAAGETLDPLQHKKIGRRTILEKERVELEV